MAETRLMQGTQQVRPCMLCDGFLAIEGLARVSPLPNPRLMGIVSSLWWRKVIGVAAY